MPGKKREQKRLNSSFIIRAELNVSIQVLAKIIQKLPYVTLKYPPDTIEYIMCDNFYDISTAVCFFRDKIVLKYSFDRASLHNYVLNLTRLITILAYLDNVYEIKLESIYQYIIEGLRRSTEEVQNVNQIINGNMLLRRIIVLNDLNIALSFKLLSLEKKISKLNPQLSLLKDFSSDVVENAHSKSKSVDSTKKTITMVLGVKPELYTKILELLAEDRDPK